LKKFSNLKTYNAHVKSKKHIEREKIAKENGSDDQQSGTSVNITTEKLDPSKSPEPVVETPVQTEQEFIDEKIANAHHYEPNECLICFKIQESFEVNIEHMAKEHGLYIPDLEYVTDLPKLISYLGQKVGTGNACLYCNQVFCDAQAVTNHMKSLSHAKLKYDDDDMEELDDFYDFSKTWESIDGNEDVDINADLTPEQEQQLIVKSGKGIIGVSDGGYSLTLASGKTIGHRDLMIYYKQNYRRIDSDPEATRAVINRYKALGWKTSLTSKERTDQRKQHREFYKQQMQVSCKANRLQKHFREQVLY